MSACGPSRHPRQRRFREGTVWRIAECSGAVSGQRVAVIRPFFWREAEDGTYRPPGPSEVPVRYQDGRRGFMFVNRLVPFAAEEAAP